jgi:hypothetical protein
MISLFKSSKKWGLLGYIYENGCTFTKLFMHVSSRNMFPTTRNLQIHVHVYRPRHYCGDWLTVVPCVPHKNNCKKKMGSHDMKQTDSSIIIVRNVCVLTSASMIVYLFFTRSWSAIKHCAWAIILSTNLWSRAYHLHYCTGKQNYLLSNSLRFALEICFWADF